MPKKLQKSRTFLPSLSIKPVEMIDPKESGKKKLAFED